MKFDIILAQYLYQHKKLNLPGIGTFDADNTVNAGEDEKQKFSGHGITFKNSNVSRADDTLIEFITEHTGKMKPLAISDLESYLTLGKQFLYIGKPFYLEGIGTLSLAKDGRFDFTPGEYVTTKLEDPNVERSEGKRRAVHEEDRVLHESSNNNIKKVLLLLGVLVALGLIGWGAYYFYTMNANRQNGAPMQTSVNMPSDSGASLPRDTLQASGARTGNDSTSAYNAAAAVAEPGSFKFVVEKSDNKVRAMNRFRVLKSYGNKIQIETADSIHYKLFFILPAIAADTARVRDSLNRWYYGNTQVMRVTIER